MSDNKKYYYLKLKDNFFDSDQMIVLESMPDGYKYSNILLKLYLRSLKNDGKLMFNDRIPYNSTILSQVTRHSVGDVEKAVKIFAELGLIEVLNNGAIYMLDIQNFIGESSTEGDRKRAYRRKIEQEKNMLLGEGQMSGQMSDIHPPEIEIEKELDKEIDIDKEQPSNKLPEKDLKADFDSIWKEYPNKKGKARAFTAYKKAIKDGVDNQTIINGIRAYKKEIEIKRTEPEYIKHGANWFRDWNWEDDYQTKGKVINSAFAQEAPTTADNIEVSDEEERMYQEYLRKQGKA